MEITITGALGHIGSYLSKELPYIFPQYKFLLIDNLSTQRYCSLFKLPKNCSFIEADVTKTNLDYLLKKSNYVIHLAAMTDAAGSFNRAKQLEENNFQATQKVAIASGKAGASLIHLSSTSVYGTQEKQVDENCTAEQLNPQSPYAETKLKEEEWLRENHKNLNLKYITCRFGTIAGVSPGMRFHTAVNKFSWQASLGLPISVWKTALHQKRPYLDLVDACGVIEHIIKEEIFDCSVYNIVTENHTVNDIIGMIREVYKNLEYELVEAAIMNQLSYEVLSNKIKEKGFRCKGSIQRAIHETLTLIGNRNPKINDK